MGIPRAVSLRIAAQTMKGAGELLLSENMHPGELEENFVFILLSLTY